MAAGTKRPRQEQALEVLQQASAGVLTRQRTLAHRQLSAMVKGAHEEAHTRADLQRAVERARKEAQEARIALEAALHSGAPFADAAVRAGQLQKASEQLEQELAQCTQRQRDTRKEDLVGVMRVQGVVVDLLRLLVLQERVLAHGMAEEELAFVWGAVPETHAAWERLNAEHSDATATDPLAEGWREDPPQQAVERAADGGGNGNGGGGSAGSAATASAPAADASGRAEARLPPGTPQAGPARAAGQAAPAASSGHGVSVLRWSTSTKKHHCALLVRDTHTGWELERPYHEGMEQQLPERFKVKFLARMLPSEDPVASVPPGRSFLYLHNPGHGVDTAPTLTLLGVVEEAQLVERSADPMIKRHVYHLGVRRVRDDGSSNVRHQGAQWDRGSALRNVLVYHFGLSIAQADAVPVLLDAQTARSVLHLHDGTPHVPG